MKYEIIDIEKLNYINIPVSEKINENYLSEFILTTLKENEFLIQKKSKIFYTYLDNTNEYQITLYQASKNLTYPIVNCINTNDKGVNLSIHNNFFTVFIDGILYYYQKIDSCLQEDEFVNYVQKRLNISIDNVCFIKESPLNINNNENSINHKQYKNRLNYIPLKTFFEMQLYFVFIIVLISLSLTYFYTNLEHLNSNETQLNSLRSDYENIVNSKKNQTSISLHLGILYKKINTLNLKLLSLKFEKKTLFIKLSSLNKTALYAFINSYKYKSKKQSLIFDSNKGYYVLDTTIKFM